MYIACARPVCILLPSDMKFLFAFILGERECSEWACNEQYTKKKRNTLKHLATRSKKKLTKHKTFVSFEWIMAMRKREWTAATREKVQSTQTKWNIKKNTHIYITHTKSIQIGSHIQMLMLIPMMWCKCAQKNGSTMIFLYREYTYRVREAGAFLYSMFRL